MGLPFHHPISCQPHPILHKYPSWKLLVKGHKTVQHEQVLRPSMSDEQDAKTKYYLRAHNL